MALIYTNTGGDYGPAAVVIPPANAVAANAAGDTYQWTDRTCLVVRNASASPITVTVQKDSGKNPAYVPGYGSFNIPVIGFTVAAGDTYILPPVSRGYVDETTNLVTINYSAATSVTVAAFRFDPR